MTTHPATAEALSNPPEGKTMEKYTPELLLGLMATVMNIALIIACAWTTTKLYQMSGSWHCLWTLLMLLATNSATFVRD